MLIYCPTQKKKVPSLQVDRDAYEIAIMTSGARQYPNIEDRKAARRKAIQERKERMKNPSW